MLKQVNSKAVKTALCIGLSAILLSGCSFKNPKLIGAAVSVNGGIIKKSEIEKLVDKRIDIQLKAFGGAKNFKKTPDNTLYTVLKDESVKYLIIKELLNQEFDKRGLKITEADIENEMDKVVEKVGTKDQLISILKERHISNREFMEDLKAQIKMKKLADSISKTTITDADAKKYYEENEQRFIMPDKVKASHILISANTLQTIQTLKAKNKNITPEEMNKEVDAYIAKQQALAQEVLAKVKANPDNFAVLAKEYSQDRATAERGGDLGYFAAADMVPEFSKAAFAMKPNTVSQTLVKSPYGFHIIKVTDRVTAGKIPFSKVKEDLKEGMRTEKQVNDIENLTESLLKTADIKYLDKNYEQGKLEKNTTKNTKEVK